MIEPTQEDICIILRDDYIKLCHLTEELQDDLYKNFLKKGSIFLDDDLMVNKNQLIYSEWARVGTHTGFRMSCCFFDLDIVTKLIFQFDYSSLELDEILSYKTFTREYPIIDLPYQNNKRITLYRQEYPIYGIKLPTYYIKNNWQQFVDESKTYIYPILKGVLLHNIETYGIEKAKKYLNDYENRLNRKYPYWYELRKFREQI